jgi:hypothetical protein
MLISLRHANAKPARLAAALVTVTGALALNLPAASATETGSRGDWGGMTREVQTDKVLLQDPARRHFERLDEREIKRYYRACAGDAVGRRVGSSEIRACSIAYDVLLTRHFGGDFMALLTWSRAHRGEQSE